MRHRYAAGSALGLLLLLGFAACTGSEPEEEPSRPPDIPATRLISPGGQVNDVSGYLKNRAGETFLIGSMTVCPESAGEVEVTGVEPLDGDAEITGWALRPNPFLDGGIMIGFERKPLSKAGLENGSERVLTVPCGDDAQSYELVVEMRAAETDTSLDGFVVSWSSGSDSGELPIKLGIDSCVDFSSTVCKEENPGGDS